MTETIIRKFNRRMHLLNLIKGPYLVSDELFNLSLWADLGRSAEAYLKRMKGLQ